MNFTEDKTNDFLLTILKSLQKFTFKLSNLRLGFFRHLEVRVKKGEEFLTRPVVPGIVPGN